MIRLSRQRSVLIGCLAAALAAPVAVPAAAQNDVEAESAATPMTKGEARLAKLLEGRVAGKPVRCIQAFRNLSMQTIDGTAYVYGRGDTVWVQRTREPELIDDNDYLQVIRRDSARLCREDHTVQIQRYSGIFTGTVFFDDFVPYTRVKPGAGEG